MADSDLGQLYAEFFQNQCASVACATVVTYEFMITLEREVAVVWQRKINATSLLLLSSRLFLFLGTVPARANDVKGCEQSSLFILVFGLLTSVQIAVFSALRVFAIWNRSYTWSTIVFVLSMGPFVVNFLPLAYWHDTQYLYFGAPIYYCLDYLEGTDVPAWYFSVIDNSIMEYSARSAIILADIIVVVLTWAKTFRQWREARRLKMNLSISTCLLRDGSWYFIVLLALNVAQMATYSLALPPVGPFTQVLPSLLMNRFIFNLRSASSPDENGPSQMQLDVSRFSEPRFQAQASRLGNIGEDLDLHAFDCVPMDAGEADGGASMEGATSTPGEESVGYEAQRSDLQEEPSTSSRSPCVV